jgi:hypothetical protein
MAEVAGSIPAGRIDSKVRGVDGSTASSNLVGPGSNPGGPAVAGRSGSVIWTRRFDSGSDPHFTTATNHLLRAGTAPVIDS